MPLATSFRALPITTLLLFAGFSWAATAPLAQAQTAPELAFSPDLLEATVAAGGTVVRELTLSNTAPPGNDLEFSFPAFAAGNLLERAPEGTNGAGGPDDFGYMWIDSDEPGGPTFDWFDISGVGTEILLDNEGGERVALPFAFEFYGEAKTEVIIGSNGLLGFGDHVRDSGAPIPAPEAPNDLIVAFWENLDPDAGGSTYYYHDASTGRFIVQYTNMPRFCFGCGDVYTFQVILHDNDTIRYQYLEMNGRLNEATAGIENAAGDVGLEIAHRTAYVHDSLAVVIARVPDFITDVEPASGTIAGGESQTVAVTFSAEGRESGVFSGRLGLVTNDPARPTTLIPVEMTVQGGTDAIAPGQITDLTAASVGASVDLSWTAPADDAGNPDSGPVASYDIRYTTEGAIEDAPDFASATPVSNPPAPASPGIEQSIRVEDLVFGQQYWFAIRATDDAGNTSLSNSPTATTGSDTITVTVDYEDVDFGGDQTIDDLPGPDGEVSFPEAVIAANNVAGPQSIFFDMTLTSDVLPGSDILLEDAVPVILDDDGTTIDGTTQDSSGVLLRTTAPFANGSGLLIKSDGNTVIGLTSFLTFRYGIEINGNNNTVKGCVFNAALSAGVLVTGSNNTIGGTAPEAGNLFARGGTTGLWIRFSSATGNVVQGNTIIDYHLTGVDISDGASNNLIGGASAAARNVINGNGHTTSEGAIAGANVNIEGGSNNTVQGNFIGTGPTGTQDAGNISDGIRVSGTGPSILDNVISGHNFNPTIGRDPVGLLISGTDITVQGNLIGTDTSGANPLPNKFGVVTNGVGVTVGGTEEGAANVIAFNELDGIATGENPNTAGNTIRGNSIFANGELGIDLAIDGLTANDPGDADEGPNRLQNFPEIQSAGYDAGANEVTVTYRVPSDPSLTGSGVSVYPLTVDFYKADVDSQEGRAHLGTDVYDAGDHGSCGSPPCTVTVTFTPLASVTGDDAIVPTATDDNGNTSEFGAASPLGAGDTLPPGVIADLAAALAGDTAVELTWTAPADDAGDAESGPVASYDIRYSTGGSIEDATDFASATPVDNPPAPEPAGTEQSVLVEGLASGTQYWFAVRATDDAGNTSLSNSPSATTGMEVALYGDVSLDGKVNGKDPKLILKYLSGKIDLSEPAIAAGDVDGSGELSTHDASLIKKYVKGDISCFPVEEGCDVESRPALALRSKKAGPAGTLAWGTPERAEAPAAGDVVIAGGDASSRPLLRVPLVLKETYGSVLGVELTSKLDLQQITVDQVEARLPDGWLMVHNVTEDGLLKIVMAGTTPLDGGRIATVTLRWTQPSNLALGKFTYRELSLAGEAVINEAEAQAIESAQLTVIPEEFAVSGNFPNPFTRSTTIAINLPEDARVTLEVYDVLGRRVMTFTEEMDAGTGRRLEIYGRRLSSGHYFYRVMAEIDGERHVESGRVVLVK